MAEFPISGWGKTGNFHVSDKTNNAGRAYIEMDIRLDNTVSAAGVMTEEACMDLVDHLLSLDFSQGTKRQPTTEIKVEKDENGRTIVRKLDRPADSM